VLQHAIIAMAHQGGRFDYRRVMDLLRLQGIQDNHKRVFRQYQDPDPIGKRRRKRGLPIDAVPLASAQRFNEVWRMDSPRITPGS